MDLSKHFIRTREVGIKTGLVLQKRLRNAQEALDRRVQAAGGDGEGGETASGALAGSDPVSGAATPRSAPFSSGARCASAEAILSSTPQKA